MKNWKTSPDTVPPLIGWVRRTPVPLDPDKNFLLEVVSAIIGLLCRLSSVFYLLSLCSLVANIARDFKVDFFSIICLNYVLMLAILLFYLIIFSVGFALCVMPGPVAIEVFHHALKKQNKHALSIGLGAGVGDGVWAMVAFFGITPFLKNGQGNHLEGIFLLVAAVVTFIIGNLAIKNSGLVQKVEKTEEQIADKVKRKRKRWSFLKGVTLMLVNPLGIGSWMIVLSFLKKTKIYIPLTLTYEIFFFVAVVLGAFSYSIVIVAITNRIKGLFDPEKTAKIVKILGYLLVVFSIYFLFHSIRAFFFSAPG